MITAVVFFLLASSAIVFAVASSGLREFKIVSDLIRSKESYFLAEAGNEDVSYRLRNNLPMVSPEVLTLNGYTVTTSVTNPNSNSVLISSTGDRADYVRKVFATLSRGGGVSFNYGVQVGEGGAHLYNSSSIAGNLFSNGPVVGNSAINTGDATDPELLGSFTVGGYLKTAQDLAVSGVYAYVLMERTLDIINVANPQSPSLTSTITTQYYSNPYQTSVAVSNNYLYITHENQNFLDIYNVSNPASPVLLPHVPVGAQARDVAVSAGYAYVANYGSNSLTVINVANPAQAVVTATVSTMVRPKGITISGAYLYLVYDDYNYGGVQVFSLANPALPTPLGNMGKGPSTMYTYLYPAYKAGNLLYVLSLGWSGFYIVDVSNPSNPVKVYTSPQFAIHDPAGVDGAGGYLYVANYSQNTNNRTFEVWSLANPSLPTKIKSVNVSASAGNPKTVVVKNGYAYLLNFVYNGQSTLQIYSISGGGGNTVYGDVISAGPTGSVSQIHATSSIYAHTITNSVIDKDAYYQTISGVSVGRNSYPDSVDQATSSMPISDAVIAGWESDAASGGTINTPCHYQIDSNTMIGPKKINCDLEISGNTTITLTGPIWVKGNVTIKNSAIVRVSPSLSGKTLQIIADDPANPTSKGKINLDNSASFVGSGANSYIMLISMNRSAESGGGVSAIETNNSLGGGVILYAPHGEAHIDNNVQVKEVTAYKLIIKNSAKVIYENGLQNVLFTSGSGGSYAFGGWGEQ